MINKFLYNNILKFLYKFISYIEPALSRMGYPYNIVHKFFIQQYAHYLMANAYHTYFIINSYDLNSILKKRNT